MSVSMQYECIRMLWIKILCSHDYCSIECLGVIWDIFVFEETEMTRLLAIWVGGFNDVWEDKQFIEHTYNFHPQGLPRYIRFKYKIQQ